MIPMLYQMQLSLTCRGLSGILPSGHHSSSPSLGLGFLSAASNLHRQAHRIGHIFKAYSKVHGTFQLFVIKKGIKCIIDIAIVMFL